MKDVSTLTIRCGILNLCKFGFILFCGVLRRKKFVFRTPHNNQPAFSHDLEVNTMFLCSRITPRLLAFFLLLGMLPIAIASCVGDSRTPQRDAMATAEAAAAKNAIYTVKNDIELTNYNRRQEISDDPTTIIWTTSSFPNPSSPIFTVPVAGKLTSSNKRPYPTTKVSSEYSYNPELPGPDRMYGSSGEYRYGFGPAGKSEYYEWYNMPTFGTTVPKVWQRQSTTMVIETDQQMLDGQNRVRELLRQAIPYTQKGDTYAAEAQRLLSEQKFDQAAVQSQLADAEYAKAQPFMDEAQRLLEQTVIAAGGQ